MSDPGPDQDDDGGTAGSTRDADGASDGSERDEADARHGSGRDEDDARHGSESVGSSDTDASGLVDEIARGGGLGVAGRVAGKVLSVLLQVLLTRFLGPSRYGLYVLGNSVTRVGQRIAQLGLDQGALRYGSVYLDEDERRLGGTIAASVVVSVVSAVAMVGLLLALAGPIARVVFDDPALEPALRAFALAVPFYVLLELAAAYFQAFRRIGTQQFLTSVFRQVSNLVLVGGAFLLGYRLQGAIGGFVLTGVLGSIVGFYLLFGVHDAPLSVGRAREVVDRTWDLLSFSLPMMFVAMSFLLATRMDRIMLGILSDAESVGIYNVAAMIAFQFSIVLSSLISILKPIIADVADAGDTERMGDLYAVVAKWATYGTVPPYVAAVLFATPILSVFGPAFTEARVVLYVLPLLYLVGSVTGPCGAVLAMSGRQNLEVGNQAVLVVLNVVFNYMLIPVYGALGAAVAVVLAGAVTNAIQVSFVYVIYGFHPFGRDHLLRSATAAAAVITAVVLATSFPVVERTVAGAVLVGAWALLFYRQVGAVERDLFERALS